jgi:hypothetical protein
MTDSPSFPHRNRRSGAEDRVTGAPYRRDVMRDTLYSGMILPQDASNGTPKRGGSSAAVYRPTKEKVMEYRTFYLFDRVDMPLPDLVDLRPAADASVVVEGERFVPEEPEHWVKVRSESGYVFGYRGNLCDDLRAHRPRPFAVYSILENDGKSYFFHIEALDWSSHSECWVARENWIITRISEVFARPTEYSSISANRELVDGLIDRFRRAFVASMLLFPQFHIRKIPNIVFQSHDGPGGRHLSWSDDRTPIKIGEFNFDPVSLDPVWDYMVAISDRATGDRFWIHGGVREPNHAVYRYSDAVGEIESIIYSTDDASFDKDPRSNTLGHFRPRIVDSSGNSTFNQNIDRWRLLKMVRLWSASRVIRSFVYQSSFSVDIITPATEVY